MPRMMPRLAASLRKILPQAKFSFPDPSRFTVEFGDEFNDLEPSQARKTMQVRALVSPWTHLSGTTNSEPQIIETTLVLSCPELETLSQDDRFAFMVFENSGLRGLTLLQPENHDPASLLMRCSYFGSLARTADEREMLLADVINMMNYASQLEGRIERCSIEGHFCWQMYLERYGQVRSSQRHLGFARGMFTGSLESAFKQIVGDLSQAWGLPMQSAGKNQSTFTSDGLPIELRVRLPEGATLLTFHSPITSGGFSPPSSNKTPELLNHLNQKIPLGHFENKPGTNDLEFVGWKHLTSDLQIASVVKLLSAAAHAHEIARRHIKHSA